jgi:hypothetical protein
MNANTNRNHNQEEKMDELKANGTVYQITKTSIIDASRRAKGTSQFSQWVRDNYNGKFIVSVAPFTTDGTFNHEPLKNRGYTFSGAGSDKTEMGLLVGKNMWFRAFGTMDEADAEVELLTETGV